MSHAFLAAALGLLCALASAMAAEPSTLQSPQAIRVNRAVELLDAYRGDTSMLEAARADLDGVLRADARYAPAHREMARYYIMRGHIRASRFQPGALEAADAAINKAIALNPSYADAFVLRGHLYRLMNRHQDAVAALEKAQQLGTADPWLQNNWADLLIDEEKYDEAALRYRRVIDSNTRNKKAMTAAFEGLIRYYIKTANLDRADEMYRKQIAFEPDAAWSYGNYAQFLLCQRDNYEGSIARSREALQIMNYGVGRYWLASALYRKWAQSVSAGRVGEGTPSFAEAQALHPNPNDIVAKAASCPPLSRIGEALIRTGGGPK